jgi:hypothetical protein
MGDQDSKVGQGHVFLMGRVGRSCSVKNNIALTPPPHPNLNRPFATKTILKDGKGAWGTLQYVLKSRTNKYAPIDTELLFGGMRS